MKTTPVVGYRAVSRILSWGKSPVTPIPLGPLLPGASSNLPIHRLPEGKFGRSSRFLETSPKRQWTYMVLHPIEFTLFTTASVPTFSTDRTWFLWHWSSVANQPGGRYPLWPPVVSGLSSLWFDPKSGHARGTVVSAMYSICGHKKSPVVRAFKNDELN